MRRREFIAVLSGAAVAWPFAAYAQQPALARIGLLLPREWTPGGARDSIIQSLAERGYVDGKTAKIDGRSAGGQLERLPELARELVVRPVDVIVAVAASAT